MSQEQLQNSNQSEDQLGTGLQILKSKYIHIRKSLKIKS